MQDPVDQYTLNVNIILETQIQTRRHDATHQVVGGVEVEVKATRERERGRMRKRRERERERERGRSRGREGGVGGTGIRDSCII